MHRMLSFPSFFDGHSLLSNAELRSPHMMFYDELLTASTDFDPYHIIDTVKSYNASDAKLRSPNTI